MDIFFEPMKEFDVHEAEGEGYDMQYFHYHDEYELFFINEGNRSIIINDDVMNLSRYDVGLVASDLLHRTAGPKYSRTIIYFSKDFLLRSFSAEATERLLSCFSTTALSLTPEEYMYIRRKIDRIKEENVNDENNRIYLLLGDILYMLDTAYARHTNKLLPLAKSNTVSNALNYINENYSAIRSIDEIADALFISKHHLCRIFKASTSLTINQYLNSLRMKKACDLLISTKKTASAISEECGFNSPIYFSQFFQKQMGCTPINYRKTNLQMIDD